MKIVALDLSTQTGVAVGCPGSSPTFFSETFGESGDHQAARFSQCLDFINRLIRKQSPNLVVIEEPIATGVTGKKHRVFLAAGLRACVFGVCRMRGVRVAEYPVGEVRKHFIGVGNLRRDEAKRQVFAECLSRGWQCANDNESDAGAVWDLACAKEGYPVSPGGLFSRM